MTLQVTSEYGRLREAIVHRPGRELVRMTPSTRDYFLFDDLLYDEHAQQEHDWFVDLLQNHLGVKVHSFDAMLAEALEAASAAERESLVAQACSLESDMPPVEQRIGQLEVMVRWFQGHGWPQYTQDPEGDPKASAPGVAIAGNGGRATQHGAESFDYLQYRLRGWCDDGDFRSLAEELIEGIESGVAGASPSERPGPNTNGNGNGGSHEDKHMGKARPATESDADALRRYVEGRLFYLTPLPNLMFMSDLGAVVNDRLLLARMAAPGRAREPLLLDFVQRHHPRFKDTQRWTWADKRINDPAWPFASSPLLYLEGGNVVQLREDLLVLGVSRRTTLEGVQRVAEALRAEVAAKGKKMTLYVLRLPAGSNHLDSVFGAISPTECVVYGPVFEPYGPASVDVVRIELGAEAMRPTRAADFFESLRRDGLDLTCIQCGGVDPVDQQREQWFSAANLLAVAPGKVIIYRSSEQTIAALAEHGYQIIDVNDVQTGTIKLDLDAPGKWALKIKGSELSRGHGGPNSLVLPIMRDT